MSTIINPSNLPSSLARVYAFRDHNLDLRFIFPDGFDLTNISAKLYYKNKFHIGLVSISISGNIVIATLTKEDFTSINLPIFQFFLYKGNTSIIGSNIELKTTGGIPVLQDFTVTLPDESIIQVEVVDYALINNAAERAEQSALEATQANEEAQAIVPAIYAKFDTLIPVTSDTTSIPLRKLNTLYNILDIYTGESLTYNKIINLPNGTPISDSNVDNVIYKKYGSEYFQRNFTGFVELDWFGAIGNGIADDTNAINKILSCGITKIRFGKDKIYRITTTQIFDNSYDIDMNGSTIISSSGFIRLAPPSTTFTSVSSYFTSVALSNHFTKMPGVTDNVVIGDVLDLYCSTPRPTAGDYFDALLTRVVNIIGNEIYVAHPFWKAFDVNRIMVLKNRFFRIKNGTVKMTGSLGTKGISVTRYDEVSWDKVDFYGQSENQAGFDVISVTVSGKDSYASGIKDTTGFSGGRLGYGFSAAGSSVTVDNLRGSNCKHVFTSGTRSFMTLDLRVINYNGYNPPEEYNTSSGVVDGGPLYQGIFDIHANCLRAHLVNPTIEGCNTLIAIRNGHCIIDNPILRSKGVQAGFNNNKLICIYEEPVRQITINNPIVTVDMLSGQTEIPAFIGFQTGLVGAGNHKNIEVNNLIIDGGKLFEAAPPVENIYSTDVNIESIIFRNVKGKVQSGIIVKGLSSTTPLGNIGEIILQGDIQLDNRTGSVGKLIHVEFVNSIKKIIGKNSTLDGRIYDSGAVIDVTIEGNPPEIIDFSNSDVHSGASAFKFANSPIAPFGKGNFDNIKVLHNYTGISSFTPGIYTSIQNGVDEWTTRNASFINKNPLTPATNNQNIRATGLSKFHIDGSSFNTDLAITDQSFWTILAQTNKVPLGVKSDIGYVVFAGKRLKSDGFYLPIANQIGAGTNTAMPNAITVNFAGQKLYNDGFVSGSPSYWIGVSGTTWLTPVDYNTIQYHQENILGSDNFDTFIKNGIRSVTTQLVADTVQNIPSRFIGILETENLGITNASTSCIQEYTVIGAGVDQGKVFRRVCLNSVFSSWKVLSYI